MVKKIKLFDPVVDAQEKKAILRVLNSGFWASGSGTSTVLKFENKFKKYLKSNECIAVNSGTSALNLALSLFDIKDREVILPSLSFVSTAHCILENKGIPVFVDVEPESLCIDPKKIISAITKKTKMILPVHFGGMPCNLNEIQKISKKHKLDIVEDAAHSAGSAYKNKKIGTHGKAVCFSFHPVKNLAMPTGGLISINDPRYKKFKKLLMERRWCGITNRKGTDYDVKEIGGNYYMNEFSAAIGIEQLKKLDKLNLIRKKIGKKFNEQINIKFKMPYNEDCSYHLYWILVKDRDRFREKLSKNGIETGTHYKPIHLMSMYKQNQKLSISEKVGKQIVTLPIHPNLNNRDVDKIIRLVNRFL
jgi:dTDP-4-amino-4,6-dideoxygalactose transaminase